ncbi:MAG TPA: hypothetical protein VHO47_03725 [Candidatus Babeliales bacterium]|nr:hypothetical protein [Candidatus Babeliales bacterium]
MTMAKAGLFTFLTIISLWQSANGVEDSAQQLTKETVKQIAHEVSKSVIEEQQRRQATWMPSKTVLVLGTAAIGFGLLVRHRWWATPTDLKETNAKANLQFQNKLMTFEESFKEHMKQVNGEVDTNGKGIGKLQVNLEDASDTLGKFDAKFRQSLSGVTKELNGYQTEHGDSLDAFSKKTAQLLAEKKKTQSGLHQKTTQDFKGIGSQIELNAKNNSLMLTEKQQQMLKLVTSSQQNTGQQTTQLNQDFNQMAINDGMLEQQLKNVGQTYQLIGNSIGSLKVDISNFGTHTDKLLTMVDEQNKSDEWQKSFYKSEEGVKNLKQRLSLLVAAVDQAQQN